MRSSALNLRIPNEGTLAAIANVMIVMQIMVFVTQIVVFVITEHKTES